MLGVFFWVLVAYFVVGVFVVPLYYMFSRKWSYRKSLYEWFKFCNLLSSAFFGTRRVVDDDVEDGDV